MEFWPFSTDMFQKAGKSHEPVDTLTHILKYFLSILSSVGIVLRTFKQCF